MVSPQRTLRYPYNKVQGPPIIVGWTMMVSTTPAWGMEPTTSSLGAMSHYRESLSEEISLKKKVTSTIVPRDGRGPASEPGATRDPGRAGQNQSQQKERKTGQRARGKREKKRGATWPEEQVLLGEESHPEGGRESVEERQE
jgi:hypothetical protein